MAFRPLGVQPRSIGQINVEPAVVVVVEEGQSTALGLNDKPLVFEPAPHVGSCEAGLAGHIHKLDTTWGSGIEKRLGLETIPLRERSGYSLQQWRAESQE